MSATMLLLLLAVAGEEAPAADPGPILQEARQVQAQNLAAWARYRFRRRVTREKLDASGGTTSRELLEFRITPRDGGFNEELVPLDGRIPKPSTVKRHRRKARFTRHYRAALHGEGEPAPDAFTLFDLLLREDHRYVGREVVDGVACHRLEFAPMEGTVGKGRGARLGAVLEGTLWLTADGLHLYRAEARAARPVSFALSLARLSELEVGLTSQEVEAGIWLPSQIQVRSTLHVVGVPLRRRITYDYSEYEPLR